MKNLVVSFLTVLSFNLSFAQEEITVKIKDKKFYDNEAIAYVVEIPQAEYKEVERAWVRYLKMSTKEKVLKENGQYKIEKKYLPKIAVDSININSYLKEYPKNVVLAVSFKLNESYISDQSSEEIHIPTTEYVRSFAVEQYQNAVKAELNEEKKTLENQKLELNILIKSNDTDRNNIKQLKRSVIENKDLITINEIDQSNKILQVQAQKDFIYKLANSSSDAQKNASKTLKDLEKDFKQLQNKKSALHSKIDKLEEQIRAKERAIVENEKAQNRIKVEKDKQEKRILEVENKLENIK